jgi:murein DD-endopeptidase MepM/ murein hydrolase activator NlpD
MPRIPDGYGERPVPQARLQIAAQRNPGAIAEGFANIGEGLMKQAQAQFEKQDKLAYASAKANFLSEVEAAKREFVDDPNFDTFDQRFAERMKAAREKSVGMIQSKSDRALFEADSAGLYEQHRTQVAELARGKRANFRLATFNETTDKLLDVAANATDDQSLLDAVNANAENIQGAVADGTISFTDAQKQGAAFRAELVGKRFANAQLREDFGEMKRLLDTYGNDMDRNFQTKANEALIGGLENRETLGLIREHMGTVGANPQQGGVVNMLDPYRGAAPWGTPSDVQAYGASRDGGSRSHAGADYLARAGTKVFTVFGSGRAKVTSSAKGGNIVTITHDDGRVSKYMHLGSVAVKDGERVTADTVLGAVGRTGNATADLLHLELYGSDGKRLDPEKVRKQGVSARPQVDRQSLYASLEADAAERGWSPERLERAKRQADIEVKRIETVQNEQDKDAREAVYAEINDIEKRGGLFTDTSQLPSFGRLSDTDQISFRDLATRNAKAAAGEADGGVKANGPKARRLSNLMLTNPDAFLAEDLRPIAPYLTDSEKEQFAKAKTDLAEDARTWSPRTDTDGALTRLDKIGGVKLTGDEYRRAHAYVMDRARQARKELGGRRPAEGDYDRWAREAISNAGTAGMFGGLSRGSTRMGTNYRNMIIRQFREAGVTNPTEKQIEDAYKAMGATAE